MMAKAKKAAKSKPKAKIVSKPAVKNKAGKSAVKKRAAKPAVKKKASKPAVKKKTARKKASRPAVKRKAAKPAVEKRPVAKKRSAAKKKSSASSAANARARALKANINDLKKQIRGLMSAVGSANKRADALARLSARRGTAIAKFVSDWDRKANSAVAKAAKPKRKKK